MKLLFVHLALSFLVLTATEHVQHVIEFTAENEFSDNDDVARDDPGSPLFLSPLIQSGQLDEAKNLSRVGSLPGTDVVSYSGYLTVDGNYNSNMFFWFFESLNNHEAAPVVLWLQGGPGGSDMFGLFEETGPFYVDDKLQLQARNFTWATKYNMLYIDNPVGTGFSFTDANEGYSRNEDQVADNLYLALLQFFTLFSEYSGNEFYVTGESYAGKYVPSIGYKIHTANPLANLTINLKGIAIGNGLVDPITQNNYGDYLYNIGLIDSSQRDYYLQEQALLVQYIEAGKLVDAFLIFDMLLNGDFYPYPTYFKNCTGFDYYFNYLHSEGPNTNAYSIFLDEASTRKAIHVGNSTFHSGNKVERFFIKDFMNSTKPLVEALLDNDYSVMLFNGQLDLIVPYFFTMAMIDTMQWKYKSYYKSAKRIIWKVASQDVEIAGYAKPSHNFVEVLVRDAGHMVPYDQPRVGFDLITRFIDNKPWTN